MVMALEDVQVASPQAGVAVVSVANELDLTTRPEFSALLHALVRQNELVVVDLSEAFFIDSSTLHVLMSGYKLALERGASLRLQLGDECVVKRTLEVSGLLEELSWASSREEALNGSAPATKLAVDVAEVDHAAWNLPLSAKGAETSPQAPFSVQSGREDNAEPEPEAA